jgi:hypothetical protein
MLNFLVSICNIHLSFQGLCSAILDVRRSTIQITLFSYKRLISSRVNQFKFMRCLQSFLSLILRENNIEYAISFVSSMCKYICTFKGKLRLPLKQKKNIKADRHPAYNNVLTVIFFEKLIYRSFY